MAKKISKARPGRIGDLTIVQNQKPHPGANSEYVALRVQGPCGREETLLFTAHQLESARRRAQRNPEDVPKAANLFDRIRDFID